MSIAALCLAASGAGAGDVEILKVRFEQRADGAWSVRTTLRHGDTGWDHYADGWRVETEGGDELGMRTLYHPHVGEQPFTRSLSGVRVPDGTRVVVVRAHDSVHGWSPDRVRVDLGVSGGERFEVVRAR